MLDANADWRGLGTVTVEAGVTLNLRGHNLQVTDIAGTGTITSDYGITPPAAPSIVSESAIFWLDAADASTIETDANGGVSTWKSKSEVVAPRYRAAAMGVYLCGAFLIGCPATAVLGYVGQHFSCQHGIALFGATYAIGAVAVLVARIFFFRRDCVRGQT